MPLSPRAASDHPLGPATPSAVRTSSAPIAWVRLDQNPQLRHIPRSLLWLVQFWKRYPRRSAHTCLLLPGAQVGAGPEPLGLDNYSLVQISFSFISINEHRCVNKEGRGRSVGHVSLLSCSFHELLPIGEVQGPVPALIKEKQEKSHGGSINSSHKYILFFIKPRLKRKYHN